jgi:hypothetical protein
MHLNTMGQLARDWHNVPAQVLTKKGDVVEGDTVPE